MLTGFIDSFWSFTKQGSPDIGTAQHAVSVHRRASFSNGTGADQANNLFVDRRTIAGAGSEEIDLAGVLSNALGQTLTFTAIKAIRIHSDPDNGGNIVVGGAESNAFVGPFGDATDTLSIAPGGFFEVVNPSAAGWPVTAGTGDRLKVANSDAEDPASYSIEIIGEA
ncbi:hypothetical protein [Alteraurantiacibacter palmitatis]|uniref:Uncharacterized protein n=1 Tax=Alteraurantiacibacter palmitatis TaxID=2054628 RepID=A0ABV7E5W2_9SPHN